MTHCIFYARIRLIFGMLEVQKNTNEMIDSVIYARHQTGTEGKSQ